MMNVWRAGLPLCLFVGGACMAPENDQRGLAVGEGDESADEPTPMPTPKGGTGAGGGGPAEPEPFPDNACATMNFIKQPLPLNEPVSFSGALIAAQGAVDSWDPGTEGCTGRAAPGVDGVFGIPVLAGKTIHVELDPTDDSDASVYLLTQCGVVSSCVAGSDVDGNGEAESLSYTNNLGGDTILFLVVDSPGDEVGYLATVTITD
ncbi:MAG: hypothetical protein HOV80_29565 [Polyangiaceae bacterium]|nr:hypothetical protein [Polyangiaceae bacterium]